MDFPIRINKYLAEKGYCSRRQADRFTEEGRVFINGKKAELGQAVEESDVVEVDKKVAEAPANYVYYAFNKPKGIVSHNPQGYDRDIKKIMHVPEKVSVVGRLDKASRGLVLLTNDGRIVDKMLNPRFEHEKVYKVTFDKEVTDRHLRLYEKGVDIEGYRTKPAKTQRINKNSFYLTLTEGKKHQIRRMASVFDYAVRDLERVRIMSIELGDLPEGQWRKIEGEELTDLLFSLNL